MVKKKENEFEKLARLIKEEGEDIRTELKQELGNKIDKLERRMDERFTGIERRLDETIQPQLDGHARRIKVLEIKTARTH
ncbi:hypothetical protein A3C18_01535 [Candidatus Kaiserbacteria bacterium RIFCSPHIGHO2_02_FULL_54_11b]|uniref:Uncharacterized protein n=2 Tax=Candidatus Kaiseribacteriota TaxID=1752734 RepID=A0A1F6CRV9_9BACT|nr:MAG: hypothetical protein A2704_02395 [Candidatus Kaiserbacteria bacterium RIFCSPHIGHO2_01_FULL_54_36b]OGG63983.1 MAG: hypothetical protein A3C18_01535 [Candidatus Kaiserbacteria bacterium RIFCSPHIGHO2_02_FULL_54_11b]